jgi:hypothetical protein
LQTVTAAGQLLFRQERLHPCVYLDHWAIRRISENPKLAARFRDALIARNGTLAISFLNWAEFAQVRDIRQIRAAEEFLTSIMPRIYFLNVNFLEVIYVEADPRRLGPGATPEGDWPLFRDFVRELPLSVKYKLLVLAYEGGDQYKQLGQTTATLVRQRLSTYFTEYPGPKARTVIRDRIKMTMPVSRTSAFAMGTFEFLYGRRHGEWHENDANDLIHTIVPATHCQYALLDKNSCHLVDSVGRRLKELGEFPVATVYSESNSGIERFLTDLDAPS